MTLINRGKFIFPFLFVFSQTVFPQISKEERKAFRQIPIDTKITAIKSGQLLEFANEIPIEKFMVNMLWYKPQSMNKKDGTYTEEILYKDSIYTYLGKTNLSYMFDFIKVKNSFLADIDFLILKREEIENRFKEEIIPLADKRKVNEKLQYALPIEDKSYFKYSYIASEKAMQIVYRWKIECVTCISRVVNKEYQAKFNLVNRQFIK